jgi:hypothetical protein
VAHAHHVVLSRDPHLAAIGFIWPPLPSAFEIPFVLALHPFRETILAGPLFSAIFTGGFAVVFNRMLADLRIGRGLRIAALLALFANPLMWYYAGNGMTEIPFLFFVLVVAWCFGRWTRDNLYSLILASLATAGALAVRYEAAAVLAAGVVGILLIEWQQNPRRIEATLMTYIVPFAFALMLWSFWSQLFLGDALNFLRGVGSNESFTEAFRTGLPEGGAIQEAYHSVGRTVKFALQRLLSVYPPFLPVIAATTVLAIRKKDVRLMAVVLLAASVPAFQVLQVYRGQLFPWTRFWITIIPFTIVLMAMWRPHLLLARFRPLFAAGLVVCALSSVTTYIVMAGPVTAGDEALLAQAITRGEFDRLTRPMDTTIRSFRDTAKYLDDLQAASDRPILVMIDAFAHAELVLYVNNPKMLAINPDQDFRELLRDPIGVVDYILIPAPIGVAAVSDINAAYPGAWASGSPFLEFVEEFPGIARARLYRVVQGLPTGGG